MNTEVPMDVKQLAERIQEAKAAYYGGQAPLMSDAAFDALEDQLRKMDPDHPVLKMVGAAVPDKSGWPKVKHGMPMSSLNKALDPDELATWWRSCGRATGLFVTEKLDGISVAMRWENGTFVQALTRGDGEVGEDITRNVLYMKGFPRTAGTFSGWVRGEIVCRKSDHAAHFSGDSNPRNTASGTAKRQSDPEPCRHLTVYAYQLLPDTGTVESKEKEFEALKGFGFAVPNSHIYAGLSRVTTLYENYTDRIRDGLDYDIDGLVVEVNDTSAREAFGEKNHRPAGSVALKFPHESKDTILRDIVWQVGNSGRVTPVALFDVVVLGGREIKRASLATVEQVLLLKLSQGCRVMASLRGDTIPRVEANLDEGVSNK